VTAEATEAPINPRRVIDIDFIRHTITLLKAGSNLIVEAAPGAGKTTRIPPALLAAFPQILVLEPRRIAARMAARRVAMELNERPGETVGYQVRFEETAGPNTRLRYLTEGVLTRRLVSDPELRGVSVVILDEFHERHLETDLALAMLRRLQKTRRPDLRIVVMSATLDAEPVRRFLGDCPALSASGRLFPMEVAYTPYSPAPLEEQVANALEGLLKIQTEGDVLVFLPGSAEIRRAARACDAVARRFNLQIAQLYGDLPPAEQDRAVEPSAQRKVILSTNIAESSITIEGVRAVIDSGLARVACDSPFTGMPSLEVKRISKASADQRAGRAGRTGPGRVIRLYTAEDFHRRAAHDAPEIARRELSQMCLQLEAAGIRHPLELEWLEAPPAAALDAAESLLDRLNARGAQATRMTRLPVHPRIARLLLDSEEQGAGDHGCRVAGLLSSGQRINTLDDEPDQRSRAVYDQLRRFVKRGSTHDDAAIARALLAAFPDRVGRRRSGNTVLLSNGTSLTMNRIPGEFVVTIDNYLACAIEPEWLIDHLTERSEVEWNRQTERVEQVSALLYDQLVVEETRGGPVDDEAAAKLLAAQFTVDRTDLDPFLARVEFAAGHSGLRTLTEADVEASVVDLCYGLRSLAEVQKRASNLVPLLAQKIDARLLEEIAPSRLKLPGGRTTKVNYESGKPPWVASRLQDFFGMTESPRIANGKVPLVIHLLAPSQRPVQTTTDLAGFWQRLYPQLRKELGRRYPRHAWPENPL
jgi:ATP-dependent helicase HrpB